MTGSALTVEKLCIWRLYLQRPMLEDKAWPQCSGRAGWMSCLISPLILCWRTAGPLRSLRWPGRQSLSRETCEPAACQNSAPHRQSHFLIDQKSSFTHVPKALERMSAKQRVNNKQLTVTTEITSGKELWGSATESPNFSVMCFSTPYPPRCPQQPQCPFCLSSWDY